MAELPAYKTEFINTLVRCGALRFGEFKTKSGRVSPYFVNIGSLCDGSALDQLATAYACALDAELGDAFDNLYGPAYKGITLAAATATAIWQQCRRRVTFTYNRKEAKDHGEGGLLVGHQYRGGERVVIVEDVVTAGTSVNESIALLRSQAAVTVTGLVVAVDRQERGQGQRSALAELRAEHGLATFAVVSLDDIVRSLHGREIDGQVVLNDAGVAAIGAYRERYGA